MGDQHDNGKRWRPIVPAWLRWRRLDENNREIEMQKLEIRRLREQVRTLLRKGSVDGGIPDALDDMTSYHPGGADGQQVLQGRELQHLTGPLPDLPEHAHHKGSRPPSQQSP